MGWTVVLVVVLALPGTLSASGARQCLAALEGVAAESSVRPEAVCPELVDRLRSRFPDSGLVPGPGETVSAAEMRSLARAVEPVAAGRVQVAPAEVARLVEETRIDAVPDWLERLREWLKAQDADIPETNLSWLRELADWLRANDGWLMPTFEGLLALLILALIVWIVVGMSRPAWRLQDWLRRRSPRRQAAGEAPGRGPVLHWDAIAGLDAARQVPALLAWLVTEWERTGRVPDAARQTDGQLLQRLMPVRPVAEKFAELARAAEAALYGGRVPDEARRQRCFRLARELHEAEAVR